MTSLAIALVASVAMLCSTRLIGRWFDWREAVGRKTNQDVSEIRATLERRTRGENDLRDDYMRLAERVATLESARANKEVWK